MSKLKKIAAYITAASLLTAAATFLVRRLQES